MADLPIGSRVTLNDKGRRELRPRNPDRHGTIIRRTQEGIPVIQWDDTKTPSSWGEDFLKKVEGE